MAIGDTGTFTDPRDGQVYPWKIMKDGKMWMTKNYNFKSAKSVCYDNKESNGQIYGRMYDLKEAKNFAPDGWRLASNYKDYDKLLEAYHFSAGDPRPLLAEGPKAGEIGLNLLFGGTWGAESQRFTDMGEAAFLWTSSYGEENNELASWTYIITKTEMRDSTEYMVQGSFLKWNNMKCYVRYVKDVN